MKNIKEFKPLWKFIKDDKWKIILATIFIFITEIANTLGGYLNGQIVEFTTKLDIKNAFIYLIIYLSINILIDGILYMHSYKILQTVENKISRRLSFNTYKKALDLPSYAFEKSSSGQIISRITNDADTLSFTFGSLIQMITSIIGAIFIMVYIIMNSWIIALEIIIFLLLLFIVIKKYNPRLIKLHKERRGLQDSYFSVVNESIRGIRDIKTLGVKSNLLDNVKEQLITLFNKSNDEINVQKKFRILNKIIKSLLEVVVFATCIIMLYYKTIKLSFFIAMTYYVYKYMYLINEINDFAEMYQKLYVSITRVNEILFNRLYESEKFGNKERLDIKGNIIFKNVSFAYPGEKKLLNNFNITLESGKKIAIVGRSGQGKSTIFNLLTRLFDPQKGNIFIDNYNIEDLSEKELRDKISIIRQEPFIFNRSILDNFKLLDKNIKLKKVREYCKMAYIDDYIMSLPKKYKTILGEGGVNLSGGQKQRLSIARSLAKKSKIILFDEATSALDNESQNSIKKSIDELVKDHTVIIIAHRLSTIIDADIIYIIDKGKVIDYGTHNELLNRSETYKTLYIKESLNS